MDGGKTEEICLEFLYFVRSLSWAIPVLLAQPTGFNQALTLSWIPAFGVIGRGMFL